MPEIDFAAIAPLLVLLLAFVIYCWVDISRSEVRYLPKWVWVLITTFSVPLGGVIYLALGREPGSRS